MTNKTHYIYALLDPRTSQPRYIGYTANPDRRLKQHCGETSNIDKDKWTADMRSEGHKPLMKILATADTKSRAQELEAEWINRLIDQGASLTNTVYRGCKKPPLRWVRRQRGEW